jgi:DHA1 family bicyclomycin/chloramphenicol resistance-like MFS transporter
MGMRKVARLAFIGVLTVTVLHYGLMRLDVLQGNWRFAAFFLWLVSLFCMMGLTMGNLNALAMEPVGNIAGFAASIMAAVSTVFAVILSTPIAQAFDGTHEPLVIGALCCITPSLLLMRVLGVPSRV